MQFMLRREVARELAPMPIAGALTGKDAIEIPLGIEKLGYWILSLEAPLVWHMGNTISGRNLSEIERLRSSAGIQMAETGRPAGTANQRKRVKTFFKSVLARSPGLKRAVTRIYDGLFGLLYEEI
jgi:hypothetical protein